MNDERFVNDLKDIFCGELLGEGMNRKVYRYRGDSTLVIKIETTHRSFQNVREWMIWNDFAHVPEVKKWLAPCVDISPCGIVLIQKFVDDIRGHELPKKMPKFLTDLKPANYGIFQKRVVCRDYGTAVLGLHTVMRKAKWW
jgi:hypothetical protein